MLWNALPHGIIEAHQNRRCPGAAGHSPGRGTERRYLAMRHQRIILPVAPWTDFWALVDTTSSPDGCWLYTGSYSSGHGQRYGQFFPGDGRHSVRAHRYAYETLVAPIPHGMNLLHKCPGGGTPRCVNPLHLKPGTQKENWADTYASGRYTRARGDRHGSVVHPEKRPRGDAHWTRTQPEKLARGDRNGSRTKPERLKRGPEHPGYLGPEKRQSREEINRRARENYARRQQAKTTRVQG